ncbi:hypothetical protein [Aeromonas rivipollensis]|uniref:hypothetical protein n=1 Tax=Aeromonas rivipollensis TaxID=948519 RepID=UPI001F3A8228|nr:hypothetical protein [Aeromonas rivipollensis]MCE9955383.1 hypothetical protein [Aeromonas rivipollensis]
MSRQSEQDERWLGGYRRLIACLLLLVILATLALSYRNHREEALAVSLSLLGEQFAERIQRLHGLWLDQRRPEQVYAQGVAWQFDKRGWPLGVLPLQSPSDNCRQLWLTLLGQEAQSMPTLQVLASRDGGGCEFGWETNWLIYRFSDGRVVLRS